MDMEGGRLDNVGKMSSQVIANTSGDVNTVTAIALGDASVTLTAAQLIGSKIFTITPTVARTLTTDTAANIIAALPGYVIGSNFAFTVINTAGFDVTLAAGSGVTITGNAIINNGSGTWRIRVVSGSEMIIYTEGAGGALKSTIVLSASQATTSGTAFSFTIIPSWVNRVIVTATGISISGTNNVIVQLGTSSGFVASGYLGTAAVTSADTAVTADTTGFNFSNNVAAADSFSAVMTLTRFSSGSNLWLATSLGSRVVSGAVTGITSAAGYITLGAALTQVRLTRSGSDTFDAGSVSLSYQ